MEFNFKNYVATMFIVNLSFLVVLFVVLVSQLIISVYLRSRSHNSIITIIFLLATIVIFLMLSSFSRGARLVFEKNDKLQVEEGTIEKIANTMDRYFYNGKNVLASYVYINNEKYYIMSREDLAVGDTVIIYYYPSSKVISKIIKT